MNKRKPRDYYEKCLYSFIDLLNKRDDKGGLDVEEISKLLCKKDIGEKFIEKEVSNKEKKVVTDEDGHIKEIEVDTVETILVEDLPYLRTISNLNSFAKVFSDIQFRIFCKQPMPKINGRPYMLGNSVRYVLNVKAKAVIRVKPINIQLIAIVCREDSAGRVRKNGSNYRLDFEEFFRSVVEAVNHLSNTHKVLKDGKWIDAYERK